MLINGVSIYQGMPIPTKTQSAEGNDAFSKILSSYMNLIEQTNAAELAAGKAQLDYAAGLTDDMLSVTLLQEKALASINFTVQVTNKIITAYQEIMRINL